MRTRPLAVLLVVAFGVAACSARTHRPDALALYQGEYEFSGQVSTHTVTGNLRFERDAWFLESNLGSCGGRMQDLLIRPVHSRVSFGCGRVAMLFYVRGNEFDGHAQARVSSTEQAGTRQECVQYTADDRGRRVCAQFMTVPVERTVVREGVVQVVRLGG